MAVRHRVFQAPTTELSLSMKSLQAKLPIMIFGLALCEACGIIGIFVVDHQLPREQLLLFWMAVGGVLVSAPIYTVLKTKPSPFRES